MKRLLPIALLALWTAGCTERETAASELQPAEDPGSLDQVELESEDEAYERASTEITLDNFEEELEALELELDEDPYTVDGD